jgi:hypothetical protein
MSPGGFPGTTSREGGAVRLDTTARPTIITLFGRPVWMLAAQLGLVISVVLGFGAIQPFKPNAFIGLLFCCVAAAVLFGTARQMDRIVLTGPVAAVVVWWVASYLWASNAYGWRRDTLLVVPLVMGLVVIVGLLPVDATFRGILAGCQVAMAWTIVFTITNPAWRWFTRTGTRAGPAGSSTRMRLRRSCCSRSSWRGRSRSIGGDGS